LLLKVGRSIMKYALVFIVAVTVLTASTDTAQPREAEYALLREWAMPVKVDYGDEVEFSEAGYWIHVSMGFIPPSRLCVSFLLPSRECRPHIAAFDLDDVQRASGTSEKLAAQYILTDSSAEGSGEAVIGYGRRSLVVAPAREVPRVVVLDIPGTKLAAPLMMMSYRLQYMQVPQKARIVGMALDEQNATLYVALRGPGETILTAGNLGRAAGGDALVELSPFGPEIVAGPGEQVLKAAVACCKGKVFILRQGTVVTRYWLPQYEYVAGTALLTVMDESGKVLQQLEVDSTGTQLDDVSFGNSLHVMEGRVYIKVGCNVWRYAEEGRLELVLASTHLLGRPVSVTPYGVAVYYTFHKLYWLEVDPTKLADAPSRLREEEARVKVYQKPLEDSWLFYIPTVNYVSTSGHSISEDDYSSSCN